MKKILALLLALCMVFALAACGESSEEPSGESSAPEGSGESAGGDNVIKIGVFEPLTGASGAGGKQEMLGMEYAHSLKPTVMIGDTEYSIELVPSDNESTADVAPSAAAELVSAGVSVVLGTYGSSASIAAAPTFESAKIPAIGVTCTNPQVTQVSDTYYRICFIDPFQGTVLANYAKSLGATKAYCLAKQGDDYSVGLVNYFVEAFGAENCVQEVFQEGTSDYSSYVTNAKSNGCDIFVAPVSTEAAALIIDQAATQDLGMPILAGDTWDSNVIVKAAQGKDNVHIYVTTFYQEGGNAEFDAAFKEWINSDSVNLENNGGNDMIAAVSVMGYDAYFTALQALELAGSTDPAAVNEALWNVDYTGVSGEITFNEIGDANRDSAYIKTANTADNVWEFVTVQTVE